MSDAGGHADCVIMSWLWPGIISPGTLFLLALVTGGSSSGLEYLVSSNNNDTALEQQLMSSSLNNKIKSTLWLFLHQYITIVQSFNQHTLRMYSLQEKDSWWFLATLLSLVMMMLNWSGWHRWHKHLFLNHILSNLSSIHASDKLRLVLWETQCSSSCWSSCSPLPLSVCCCPTSTTLSQVHWTPWATSQCPRLSPSARTLQGGGWRRSWPGLWIPSIILMFSSYNSFNIDLT